MAIGKDVKTVTLNTPRAANFDEIAGGSGLQDEAYGRQSANDPTQGAMGAAGTYANGQAATGHAGALQSQQMANNQASGANGNQAGAIELARRQAMGQAPGAGVQQLQQGLNQASAQQSSMAAGARGSAGLATAQANAAANRSNLQQNAFGNAGMMRAQDMETGRGMYASLTGQQRQQAGMALGQGNDFNAANAQADDTYRLGMGNAAAGFGAIGNAANASDLNNIQNGLNIGYVQDDANQDHQGWIASNRKQIVAANTEDS